MFFTFLILSYLLLFFSGIMHTTYQLGLKKNNIVETINKKIKYKIYDFIFPVFGVLMMLPTILSYFSNNSLDLNYSRSNLFLFGISLILLSIIKIFEHFFYKGIKKIFHI